ncbi:MAG: flagellar type III secretion system protein FlhB [Erythrobacter sp.]|uniref:EscU/YscU/HrcU family type III secretion system export apparatus switch protein n=1 Tax=Erythrobacter sp. TaxID=1042 RepID=UPI00262290D9|nr:flagellar type III secretion system protein FlhB [Erythrobacter sp.]MDJ0979128.1 flagellar type III secretion system protein FlhB [Erythrobacter sp.]
MSEDSDDKTFEATDKKKRDAAKKGDVLRSKELGTAAAMATGALTLSLVGPWLFGGIGNIARTSLNFDASALEYRDPGALVAQAAGEILPPIFVIGCTAVVTTLISQLLLGEGARFNPSAIGFKGSKINPVSGLKRIFGTQGLIELGKSVLKLALLASLAWWWASQNLAPLMGLGRGTLEAQLAFGWEAGLNLVALLIFGLGIIAAVDYPLQRFQRNKRLMMSLKELRDETKQAEGSPEVKSARRQRQRDLARGGVAKAMKEAEFVIVNPLHYSVALTYDPDRAPAPILVCKGRGETALAMRDIAGEEGLPILEYPALARSVYFTTQPNQMVREELYVAIAALVAFVLSLKRGERPSRPRVEVPEDLRFDGEGRPDIAASRA